MKRHFSAFVLLASVLFLTACSQEDLGEAGGKSLAKKNTVTFVIGGNTSSTRAALNGQHVDAPRTLVAPAHIIDLPCEEGETPLCLVETVTGMDETYSDAILGTRGTPVFTENFFKLYGNNLYVTAYPSGTVSPIGGGAFQFTNSNPDSNEYSHDYSSGSVNFAWPEGKSIWFFLEAPYSYTGEMANRQDTYETGRIFNSSNGSISFNYTDPNRSLEGFYDSGKNSITNGAVNQTDFLFSSYLADGANPAKDGINANILMYHCLTGVKFQMGNLKEDGTALDGRTKIKSVTLKNIYSNGSCVLTPKYTAQKNTSDGGHSSNKDAEPNDASKSAKCAVWSSWGNLVTYVETYDWSNSNDPTTDYLNHDAGDSRILPDDFYPDGTSDVSKFNLNESDASRTLYLVPQKLNNRGDDEPDAKLVIEYEVDGKTYKREASFPPNDTWQAGEIHTYTLTVNKVDVSITTSMNEARTATNALVARNTGNVTAYIRAAVVAAWCYGDNADFNNAVAPYDYASNDYTLGSGWTKGDDGFFYYANPVKAGKSTATPLFSAFTPHATSPFAGAHVEMKLFIQGVLFDKDATSDAGKKAKATEAWGSAIAGYLTVNPEN